MRAFYSSYAPWLILGAALVGGSGRARAQDGEPASPLPLVDRPRVQIKWYTFDGKDGVTPSTIARSPRLQFAGMQSGFIANPLGVDPDDDPAPRSGDPFAPPADGDVDFVQLSFGNYNPYFDLRLPGDPGMLGYNKLQSQVQLFDAGRTSLCLNLQAYTPAGQEARGLANGPSYVVPALACFQDLGFGAALHGYFGQNIQANSHWTDLSPNFQYGMAVNCPIPGTNTTGEQGLFVYFAALGRYKVDPGQGNSHTSVWEFVPGVQMRLSNSCWMSVGASRYNFLSCSWRY
jgi:hypothetical protein